MALFIIPSAYAESLIATYNSQGRLTSVSLYRDDFNYSFDDDVTAYIYNPFENTKELYLPKPVEMPAEEEKFPAVYGRELYAQTTFAVVTRVYKTLKNDYPAIAAEVLFQGKPRTFYIDEDITINSAPDAYSDLEGKSPEYLAAGDVINIAANFSGEIDEVNLIARVGFEDIVTSETDYGKNFEKLYGKNGYVHWNLSRYPICTFGSDRSAEIEYQFGVVTLVANQYYLISGKNGKWTELKDVYFSPDTIVYSCNMGKKFSAEVTNTSAILSSFITPINEDSEGNITNWDTDNDYVYALSRTVDGVATDVALFYNFR